MGLNLGYIRTSRENQTPELQVNDIFTLSPPSDISFFKEQLSAWKENVVRPEFDKLLKLIKAGKVASLYVWNIDRIYRNRKRLVEFLTLCKAFKVKVYSYNQRWLENIQQMPDPWNEIMFDLMLQIVGWIAEEESATKSNRVKMAVTKKEAGTYSYKGNKWGRKGHPERVINKVMELHREGRSIREIAALVQVYDSSNNGHPISKSAVHKIIGENAPKKDSNTACPKND